MTNIYLEHKAFAFRTLWEGHNPLEKFRRVASESARGTGRLNGAIQLAEVLQTSKRIHDKAVKCFTYNVYSTGIEKWSFDNVNNKPVSLIKASQQGPNRVASNPKFPACVKPSGKLSWGWGCSPTPTLKGAYLQAKLVLICDCVCFLLVCSGSD